MIRDKFIEKAILKHGNTYDYSLVVDTINIKEKYSVICSIHGEFQQRGDAHLNGQGCGKCKKSILKTKEEFINESNILHGNKYDYTAVEYINCKTKVTIICPIHGEFKQTPDNHLLNHSCPKCGFIDMGNIQKNIAANSFIDKAKLAHGDKYDYSLVNYINARTKVEIICKLHGIFKQSSNDHFSGRGCPKCNSSKGELEICKILDKTNINYIKEYKFNDCKNKLKLPFDFYLPDNNICIEYDGEQHYKPINFGSNSNLDVKFEKCKTNDSIKTKYCLENNIKLIRIPYFEKNIEEIISNIPSFL